MECEVCGLRGKVLTKHIYSTHGMRVSDYVAKHGQIYSKEVRAGQSERLRGSRNPGHAHGGRLSPWSEKNERISPEDRASAKAKALDRSYNTKVEYFTSKGMTEGEAFQALTERQRTFSLDQCVERYGEEEGRKRWRARQEKWMKSYKKSNYSKVSQELFNCIVEQIGDSMGQVKYATHGGEEVLRLSNIVVKPDFLLIDKKRVIEFDGEYWHFERPEAKTNVARDAKRDEALMNSGYEVIHVRERDYKKNKEEVIARCVNFLTS